MWLFEKVIRSFSPKPDTGLPLGNLTSQLLVNIYMNKFDQFVKHKLKTKYYIRYVDDFVILHESEEQLKIWKKEIEDFLRSNLKLELHPNKSKILVLNRGVNFLGFRIFPKHKILRKSNIKNFGVILKRRLCSFITIGRMQCRD